MNTNHISKGFTLESADSVRFGDEFSHEEQERNHKILLGEALGGLLLGEKIWSNMVFAFDSLGMVRVLSAFAESFLKKPNLTFQPFQICAYQGDGGYDWNQFSEVYSNVVMNRLRNSEFILSSLPSLNGKPREKEIAFEENERRLNLIEAVSGWSDEPLSQTIFENAGLSDEEFNHFSRIATLDKYIRSKCLTTKFSAGEHGVPVRLNRSPKNPLEDLTTFLDRAIEPRHHPNTDKFQNADQKEINDLCSAITEIIAIHRSEKDPNLPLKNRSSFRTALKSKNLGENLYRIGIELADAHYTRSQYRSLCYASREISSPASDTDASKIGEFWAQKTIPDSSLAESEERSLLYTNVIIPQKDHETSKAKGVNLGLVCDRFTEWLENSDLRESLKDLQDLMGKARSGQVGHHRLHDGIGKVSNQANESFRDVGILFDYDSTRSTLYVHVEDECVKSGGFLSPQADINAREFEGSNNHVPN